MKIWFLEIEDGEDENIEHEDDFLEKLKGKVGRTKIEGCFLIFCLAHRYRIKKCLVMA